MKQNINQAAIRLILEFLRASRSYSLFRPHYCGIGHILALHRIDTGNMHETFTDRSMYTSLEELDSIIKYYRDKGYGFVDLNCVHNILKGNKRDRKFIALTFDDGYAEIFTHAYPFLKKHGIPFTIYLASGIPDSTVILWWSLLEELVSQNDQITFQIENAGVGYTFQCRSTAEKFDTYNTIRKIIINSDPSKYLSTLKDIFSPYNIDLYGRSAQISLSWQQIIEMGRNPLVTIAAHTVSHRPLSKLPTAEVRSEIEESVKCIENRLNQKVEHFCYPFGKQENQEREFEIVKELSFKTATTTRFGNIFDEHSDYLHCLPRVYKFWQLPYLRYLNVFESGAFSALAHRLRRVITA